jgi:hypothetical protein
MKMKIVWILSLLAFISCSHDSKKSDTQDKQAVMIKSSNNLKEIARFKGIQVTGLTVTKDNRIFASIPRWRKDIPYSVVEVMNDGSKIPFPNEDWNKGRGEPQENQFTSVQSVLAHNGSLFVLDTSNPWMKGVIGRPKLYEFDLQSNKLKRMWEFNHDVALKNSYLNDFRIDDKNKKIYITDSGLGALVVLDMQSNLARRELENHTSTKAENVTLSVDDKVFKIEGKKPKIHSDGIAINETEEMVYFHALTGTRLYRVPMGNVTGSKVENLGKTPLPDGMVFDKQGNLYMADLENHAIVYRTPDGSIQTLVQDKRISWADSLAIDEDNNLYFTDSKLIDAPIGSNVEDMTFNIYKVSLPTIQ